MCLARRHLRWEASTDTCDETSVSSGLLTSAGPDLPRTRHQGATADRRNNKPIYVNHEQYSTNDIPQCAVILLERHRYRSGLVRRGRAEGYTS